MKCAFIYLVLTPLLAVAATPVATTQPARITLHAQEAPAREVLKRFAEQAGTTLPLSPADLLAKDPLAPVTINIDGQPFWVALEELSRKTGLEPVVSPEDPYPRVQLGLGGGDFW